MENAKNMPSMSEVMRMGLGVPVILLMMLGMMIVPLPALGLDALFTFNISLSLIVLLAVIYSRRPLDFAVFPTVLLLATLLRLALNIASTRVVLLDGHTGTDAAGQVIEAFGEFVIGGNYAVGLVVFAILVIINFVVVTKGAGRVSEVSARFTLDAMPGRQMAIDADLNAGLIGQEEAQLRRNEIIQEADFYGSMDGASKFVRGDAIAGILILFINIIGGLAIGVAQHDMLFAEAVRNYTLLTIGDGLVAQIPSLVLSTATAIIVTRVSSSQDMGGQILGQLFEDPRVLIVTAVILGVLGIIPGMPNLVFLTLAAIMGGGAYMAMQKRQRAAAAEAQQQREPVPQAPGPEIKELSWDDVVPVDTLGLEVGYRLIPLVDKNQGGQLMGRIKGIRKKLTQDLGFLIPSVHIRDNLELAPNVYRITLLGATVGEATIHPDRELAINPGQVYGNLQGIPGKDPAFGLDAVWIETSQRDHAQGLGYTVVDPSTVVATHLSHIIGAHGQELLGREEVQQLLDNVAKVAPKLVEGLVPDILPLGVVVKVLQSLLEEGIPIRDMRRIVETLADEGSRSQDPGILTSQVRIALGRSIVQQINGIANELPVITLDPTLEQLLQESVKNAGSGGLGLEPGLAENMFSALGEAAQRQEVNGQPAVLLVSALIRPVLARLTKGGIPSLRVLSYNEIPDDKQIKVVASVGGQATPALG
ncbi:flagellar biosynthesis protein FlhA [Candidatus Tenderia electrophaga]|jgi:flagellar biosynthesis protein FlhA|uniref:Flagellar biosynthesis protein FlhA n=1 Tax=Candidatus Tenderia electrophaga TaxID=1748243 RepID=A0A0S2TBY7_9GAMM|nr:flagellar biosynthesis protein FlhA [Candidatus Tenderia electrophaga]